MLYNNFNKFVKLLSIGFITHMLLCENCAFAANEICSDFCDTEAYDLYGLEGSGYTYDCYISALSAVEFDNTICSTKTTGFFLFYETPNYNPIAAIGSSVVWTFGIEFPYNFTANTCDTSSSLRFAGNRNSFNEDSCTLYAGNAFTGDDFYIEDDMPDLTVFNNRTSSLIIIGPSSWTLYTKANYEGYQFCYLADLYKTSIDETTVLNVGYYSELGDLSGPDNAYNSIRKGCFSKNLVYSSNLKHEESAANGGWGIITLS